MQVITTVTQKGQISIPKKFRDLLDIHEYDKVIVETTKDYLKIKPTKDILDLAGSFKPPVKKDADQEREVLEKKYKRF